MIEVTLTSSGVDWSNEVPIGPDTTEAEYYALASRTVLRSDGYTLDLSQETSAGFSYDEIVGKTVGEIRFLFPADNESDFKMLTVHVQGDGDFIVPGSESFEDVFGGAGNDTLDDGEPAGTVAIGYHDSLYGGAGDDTYLVHSYDTGVTERDVSGPDPSRDAGGSDTVITTDPYDLASGEAIETLRLLSGSHYGGGNEFNNTIVGNSDDDILLGRDGSDVLRSGGGDDVLFGGRGNDQLVGNSGSDVYMFRGEAGRDRIATFGADDLLLSTTRLQDNNGDGLIEFGRNHRLDISNDASAVITDENGHSVRALEYDGMIEVEGLTYYVYSRTGSAAGISNAASHDLASVDTFGG